MPHANSAHKDHMKLCLNCFRTVLGKSRQPGTITWSAACWGCGKVTPNLGYIFKASITKDYYDKFMVELADVKLNGQQPYPPKAKTA